MVEPAAGAGIVILVPELINEPPHEPEYQFIVVPMPPFPVSVILANVPVQKLLLSTVADVGAIGTGLLDTGKQAGPDDPHKFDGVTQMFPASDPTNTLIEVVPCPERIVQSPGTTHV